MFNTEDFNRQQYHDHFQENLEGAQYKQPSYNITAECLHKTPLSKLYMDQKKNSISRNDSVQHFRIQEYLNFKWKENYEVDLEIEQTLLEQLSDVLIEKLDKRKRSKYILKQNMNNLFLQQNSLFKVPLLISSNITVMSDCQYFLKQILWIQQRITTKIFKSFVKYKNQQMEIYNFYKQKWIFLFGLSINQSQLQKLGLGLNTSLLVEQKQKYHNIEHSKRFQSDQIIKGSGLVICSSIFLI